jgi:hypothetical protein
MMSPSVYKSRQGDVTLTRNALAVEAPSPCRSPVMEVDSASTTTNQLSVAGRLDSVQLGVGTVVRH